MKAISLDTHFEHQMRRAVWTHASGPRASLAEPRLRTALSLCHLAAREREGLCLLLTR